MSIFPSYFNAMFQWGFLHAAAYFPEYLRSMLVRDSNEPVQTSSAVVQMRTTLRPTQLAEAFNLASLSQLEL
jgi:hypothetical protein